MNFDPKTIIMLLTLVLGGGGTFAVYADNGALRGEIQVLKFQVAMHEEAIADITESFYDTDVCK